MTEQPSLILLTAGALADAESVLARPSAILLSAEIDPVVLASGAQSEVLNHPQARFARRIEAPDCILLPGFANAHTHLDLTHLGPLPFEPEHGFRGFIDAVRSGRHTDPASIRDSVLRGAELVRQSGTVAVGDIAGAVQGHPDLAAFQALRESGLSGISYLEFFGMGRTGPDVVRGLESRIPTPVGDEHPLRLGLQPHAPYSVSPASYLACMEVAARLDIATCTHLAETPEESDFVAQGTGPFRRLLDGLGLWHDELNGVFSQGLSPVAHLSRFGISARTVVHVNRCSDDDLELLATSGVTVVYCPQASAYFGMDREFGPHRYREMLNRGVNVALGTDSIINLPRPDRISVLDEMRFLFHRDATSPRTLLGMATVNAARSLRLDPDRFRLRVGSTPLGVLALGIVGGGDPLESALRSDRQPRLLWSRY